MINQTANLQARIESGRALRKVASRAAHAAIGNVERDPVALLETSSVGRVERLVPLRYGRMLASPFTFFRGSAVIQAHDLATTPYSGVIQQICGDCHLMNFGGFATPERNLVFDLNDFDETFPGPWEWDVKRLTASLALCARDLGFKSAVADATVATAVAAYQSHMARYAEMGALETWYDKVTLQSLMEDATSELARKRMAGYIEKAEKRTHSNLLPKIGEKVNGRWRLNDTPPGLFHIHGSSTLFAPEDDWIRTEDLESLSDKLLTEYKGTISPSHRQLLSYFNFQDMAFKVVGVGSVGTRCLIMLMTDAQENPHFLQIKEAVKSVLAAYVPAGRSAIKHQGQRVVVGQRMMQASSDIFLGASTGPSGSHFYIRQLRDMKISAETETYDEHLLKRYAKACAHTLARAHARAGGFAPEISGYIGKGEQFAEALVKYSNNYADQVERDFEVFRTACRTGRLNAQTDADFAAEFSL